MAKHTKYVYTEYTAEQAEQHINTQAIYLAFLTSNSTKLFRSFAKGMYEMMDLPEDYPKFTYQGEPVDMYPNYTLAYFKKLVRSKIKKNSRVYTALYLQVQKPEKKMPKTLFLSKYMTMTDLLWEALIAKAVYEAAVTKLKNHSNRNYGSMHKSNAAYYNHVLTVQLELDLG